MTKFNSRHHSSCIDTRHIYHHYYNNNYYYNNYYNYNYNYNNENPRKKLPLAEYAVT